MSSSFIIQKGPGIASKAYNYAKKLITGGPKVSPTITSIAPKFPKNKIQAAVRDVQKTAYAARGQMKKKNQDFDRDIQKVKSKLGQSMQRLKGEPETESGISKGKDLVKKAKGGRVGLKLGSRKSNLQKIQEVFGPKQVKKKDKVKRMMAKKGSPDPKKKKKFPDLTGDGKVTFADILKGRGVINGKKKKNKKKFI